MFSYFLKKEILSNIRTAKNERRFTDFSDLSNAVIIYELADYNLSLELESVLSLSNCDVKLIGYNGDKKRHSQGEKGYLFSCKELSFIGRPTESVLAKFNQATKNCDLIIDISRGKFLPINYLLSQKSSVLKVGLEGTAFNLYDFILEVQKNIDSKFLCQQILFYLRKLKSKRL